MEHTLQEIKEAFDKVNLILDDMKPMDRPKWISYFLEGLEDSILHDTEEIITERFKNGRW
jgi:hypothetical protein